MREGSLLQGDLNMWVPVQFILQGHIETSTFLKITDQAKAQLPWKYLQKSCLRCLAKYHTLIFTESADSVIESPCPSVCQYVCLSVPSGAIFFRGLSLALRSHDQIPGLSLVNKKNVLNSTKKKLKNLKNIKKN